MSGRVDKVIAMFNALEDTDKVAVLETVVYPVPPPAETVAEVEQVETPYEVPNPSFAERYVEQ